MNKAELVEAMATATSSTKAEAERNIDALIGIISSKLKQKEDVKLIGFGTFTVSHRKERTGHNPQTGAEIKISARNVPCFRPGKDLKDQVN
ncbi:MAG: HU family DNA-binding protein [Oligoflexales bacterium]|nr:HU family DNA-binding protein [Oligoflexales bacterium]